MSDKQFVEAIRKIKQSHERFITAILICDVFPGLDRTNPLDSRDEDIIPDQFGSNWMEYTRKKN